MVGQPGESTGGPRLLSPCAQAASSLRPVGLPHQLVDERCVQLCNLGDGSRIVGATTLMTV